MSQLLQNRKIVLGITGGIAAYKACELSRLLTKNGADVRVVMTEAATKFVGPATLSALTHHDVLLDVFGDADGFDHIKLTEDADLFVVAPATANSIAKFVAGIADDALSTAVLASACPLVVAPAMNTRMLLNPATKQNLKTLQERGVFIIAPEEGELACGDKGLGRMRDVKDIFSFICALLNDREALTYEPLPPVCLPSPQPTLAISQTKLLPKSHGAGIKIVITAGPTEEAIDPARVITNKSSGKMGYALAQMAATMGADVTLISGPTALSTPNNVKRIDVVSANQMLDAVKSQIGSAQIFIGCAAVADYRVIEPMNTKIKKEDHGEFLTLELVKNEDIISYVGHLDEDRPFTVGFAAETDHLEEHAKDKLHHKNLDLVVLNDVSDPQIGFGSDDNAATVFGRNGIITSFGKMSKIRLADLLIELILAEYKASRNTNAPDKEEPKSTKSKSSKSKK